MRIAAVVFGLIVLISASNVHGSAVRLRWTAPGDRGRVGRAKGYIMVCSRAPITEANFFDATRIPGVPAPRTAGSSEGFTVTDLSPRAGYYFALKTMNHEGLVSPISNVAFRITGPYDSGRTTGVEDSASAPSFSTPWPNPASHGTRCAYVVSRPAMFQVDVFDVEGRRVRALASGQRATGPGELDWDLRDDAGRAVAAGIYLVNARLDGHAWTRRLMVIR